MKALVIFAMALIVTSGCSAIEITPPDGVFLGERKVDSIGRTDRIVTNETEGTFKGVQFLVNRNSIELADVTVTFGSGVKQRLKTKFAIYEGSQSQVLLLNGGGGQPIRTIEFSYKSIGSWITGTAAVSVYGIR
jgi:hypothetical protein